MNAPKISFDYDNTLIRYEYLYNEAGYAVDAVYTEPHHENIKIMRDLYDQGCEIYITTARVRGVRLPEHDNSPAPEELVFQLKLPVRKVFYTSNRSKVGTLEKNKIHIHFDDCVHQCKELAKKWTEEGIGAIPVLVDAPEGINEFLKEKFKKLLDDYASA